MVAEKSCKQNKLKFLGGKDQSGSVYHRRGGSPTFEVRLGGKLSKFELVKKTPQYQEKKARGVIKKRGSGSIPAWVPRGA